MPGTTIAAIRATPVTVPLDAPLRRRNGTHRGGFVRTIVELAHARAPKARDRDPGRPGRLRTGTMLPSRVAPAPR